jgi:hypothetical protein
MRKLRNNVTAERVRQLFDYNPETGDFTWKPNPEKQKRWNTTWSGRKAGYMGSENHRYVQIFVDGQLYLGHRLAWLYVHGDFPSCGVDHIDGNPANNSIANLRPANQSQNASNMKTPRVNTSGYKGVTWCKSHRLWIGHVKKNYKYVLRSYFRTKEEAAAAVAIARDEHHGVFANHG